MLDVHAARLRAHRARQGAAGRARWSRRHVLRNALLPLVTMLGMDVAYLFGGAVLTETVFGIPGIGGLAWRAIRSATCRW